MNFWDFSAPIYDFAEKTNGKAYGGMLTLVRDLVPEGANVIEIAAGTGSISLAVANKAKSVVCTDISKNMLNIARKKALKQGTENIKFQLCNIYSTGFEDNKFDVVIASQVLHLLDEPQNAVAELKRISQTAVIVPVCLLKDIRVFARAKVNLWRLSGFNPKYEFDSDSYRIFLADIGISPSFYKVVEGAMPMAVAEWRK